MNLDDIQELIHYQFKDIHLLKTAFVHRSYLHEKKRDETITEHNERLEFLGDAVLELVITDYLFKHMNENEGVLTSLRASLVNYRTLGQVGMEIGLNDMIYLAKSEQVDSGRARLSIVADAVEALLGSMYLDGGIDICYEFIKIHILTLLPNIIEQGSYKDHKTKIQEFAQKYYKQTPFYKVIASKGKDHEKEFHVGIWIGDDMVSDGFGPSKQSAETAAAKSAFQLLKSKQN